MCSSSSIDDNQINLAKMCSNMHVVVDRDMICKAFGRLDYLIK